MTYSYLISGRAADDRSWVVNGHVETSGQGQFTDALGLAMRDAFEKLTEGKAIYGEPGVGCRGPYRIIAMTVSEMGE